MENLVGNRYSRLVVLEFDNDSYNEKKAYRWICKCDCGSIKSILASCLKSGSTKSCGCFRREKLRTHGMNKTKIHNSWRGMKERCTNPLNKRYSEYGGRGITYDQKWESFEGFYEDMGESYVEEYELDRVDVNGLYCKENCRWSNQAEQCYNQRLRKDNKSGKTGVWFNKKNNKWLAYIRVKGKRIILGYFEDIHEAIKVREAAEIEYYGYNRP